MAEKKVHLRIITGMGTKVDEKVDMVILRCIDGDIGILPGRTACAVVLDIGILRILENREERIIAVFGGIAEVLDNVVTVLTYNAEWPEEIDLARAEANRAKAERRLQEKTDDTYLQSDQVLLRRSLVRIEVSSFPLINKPKWDD